MSRFDGLAMEQFFEKAEESDRGMMSMLLSAASEWYGQYTEVRDELEKTELTEQEIHAVEASLAKSESQAKSCLISIFCLADKYGVRVFSCNPEKEEHFKGCCAEIRDYETKQQHGA